MTLLVDSLEWHRTEAAMCFEDGELILDLSYLSLPRTTGYDWQEHSSLAETRELTSRACG